MKVYKTSYSNFLSLASFRYILTEFYLFQEHILYSRQERSIDLCPLDHIDSENSTVTISISTFSDEEVDVDIKVRIKGRGIDWIQTTDTKY